MEATISTSRRGAVRSIGPYALQAAGGSVWMCALLLLLALAPVHVREIGNDWQVAAAARVIRGGAALGTTVLILRYLAVAVCLGASGWLLWRRPGQPLAVLAAVAFALLPLNLNLGGYTETWPYPPPWDAFLLAMRFALSALGLLALLGLVYCFPDGRLAPHWARVTAAAAVVGFSLFLVAPLLGYDDIAWPAGMLLIAGSFLAAVVAQIARYRRADNALRRQMRPFLIGLLAMVGLLLLGTGLGNLDSGPLFGAASVAMLLSPLLAATVLPVGVLLAVTQRGLWEPRDVMVAPRNRRRLAALATALLCLLLVGVPLYAAANAPQPRPLLPSERPLPVIVDTDLSHDDVLAILLLLRHPAVRVKAVLISGTGEVRCEAGIRNARAVLALADSANVPVACGRETPLAGNHAFPAKWRDDAGAMYGVPLQMPPAAPSDLHAADLLTSVVNASPTKPIILTLGPLTNVADSLQTDPGLADKVTAIFAMGGAVGVAGNIAAAGEGIDNTTAEWNVWVDPRAANIVLSSGAPVVLVPLDATRYVPASSAFVDALAAYRQTPVAGFAHELLRARAEFVASGGYQFWDVLAAALSIREDLARYREVKLKVIEEEGSDSGRTVSSGDGYPARMAVWADQPRFEKLFLETLNR